MTEPTPSLLQQIMDATELPPAPFTHPQYIEGVLYLTTDQWAALRDNILTTDPFERPEALWYHNTLAVISGIPIIILRKDQPATLPSGRQLLWSKWLPNTVFNIPANLASLNGNVWPSDSWPNIKLDHA